MSASKISSTERLQQLLPDLDIVAAGTAYLKLQLIDGTDLLLPMAQVRESLFIAATQITPIPNMPKSVLGLMSSRDVVFGVADLAQLLGLETAARSLQQYQLVVVNIADPGQADQLLGLTVSKILGVVRYHQPLEPPDQTLPDLQPFLAGITPPSEDALQVLSCSSLGAAFKS